MIFITNENFYDMFLISKIKERTNQKKLKKIVNNLKNIAKDEVNKFPEIKIKIYREEKNEEEKNEEEKKIEIKVAAPVIGLKHYIKDFKKSNSKITINNNNEDESENTSSTVEDNKELKQIDSSDFSDDE